MAPDGTYSQLNEIRRVTVNCKSLKWTNNPKNIEFLVQCLWIPLISLITY
jgi:hypothetical protein